LHIAQLMPLPLTVSCFSKIQTGFTFLVPAHPGSPDKGPLNVCFFPLEQKLTENILANPYSSQTTFEAEVVHSGTKVVSCYNSSACVLFTGLRLRRDSKTQEQKTTASPQKVISPAKESVNAGIVYVFVIYCSVIFLTVYFFIILTYYRRFSSEQV